jgi:hypothetical protein
MCFYLRNWQVTFLLYTLGVFISEYTAKAFTEPRDYRVVFLIQEKQETVSDFLLGGAAGGRLVFSFESSGQVGPMMERLANWNL